jgi:hypothetical protein
MSSFMHVSKEQERLQNESACSVAPEDATEM